MDKISYAVKLSTQVRDHLRAFCQARGIKQSFFVEKAIEEKLAREETLEAMMENVKEEISPLTAKHDPILAELWNNDEDAIYDRL